MNYKEAFKYAEKYGPSKETTNSMHCAIGIFLCKRYR